MATRKMTFSLPTALAARLRERDQLLARAAEVANRSPHVRNLEGEFDKIEAEILEPWDEAPSR